MDNPKCRLEEFENTVGNFLALDDLILFKRYIGRGYRVYCFTYAEAKQLLQQRNPRTPDGSKLPQNFIRALREYMEEQPQTTVAAAATNEPLMNNRGLSAEESYSNLGWVKGQRAEDYSVEFNAVRRSLEDLTVPAGWRTTLHTAYPGIEYLNANCIEKQNIRDTVYAPETDETKGLSLFVRRRYPMVPMSINSHPEQHNRNELKWLVDDWDTEYKYTGNDFKSHTISPDDTIVKKELQAQIKTLLSGVYKIHLQPKPEYQIFVLQRLFQMISKDQKLSDNICEVKALIPYSRAVSSEKIAAIVIYPAYGKESALFVLATIASAFDDLAAEIGMDITPRYNHRHNQLLYWSSYDGTSKKIFMEKYGEGEFKKVFAAPDFAHFICRDNSCHLSP